MIYSKYKKQIKEVSYDGGKNWTKISPEETKLEYIEGGLESCDSTPCDNTCTISYNYIQLKNNIEYNEYLTVNDFIITYSKTICGKSLPLRYLMNGDITVTYTPNDENLTGNDRSVVASIYSGETMLLNISYIQKGKPNNVLSFAYEGSQYNFMINNQNEYANTGNSTYDSSTGLYTFSGEYDNVTQLSFEEYSTRKIYHIYEFPNLSSVTDMSYLFNDMSKLTTINLSSFNTSSCTNMSYMFNICRSLTSIDVSSFNTSNVITMNNMFGGCSGLTSLDLSSFNTSSCTNMSYMFSNCNSLTSLNVSRFNTSNVTNMYSMFSGCEEIESLDLSGWNTSNVTDMKNMFSGCRSLTSLNVSNFNTSKITSTWDMFNGCESLTSLDLSSFDVTNVTSMNDMFYNCINLTELNLSGWDMSKATYFGGIFSNCNDLTTIYCYNCNQTTIDKLNNYKPSNCTLIY